MQEIILFITFIIGVALITAGVYIWFGLPPALIVSGSFLIATYFLESIFLKLQKSEAE